MHPRVFAVGTNHRSAAPEAVRVFLVVRWVGRRPAEIRGALARLAHGERLPIAQVNAYYRPDGDTALFELVMKPRKFTAAHRAELVVWARGEGIALIAPDELPPRRRRWFYQAFRPRFERVVYDFSLPYAALTSLLRFRTRAAAHRELTPRPIELQWRARRPERRPPPSPERDTFATAGTIQAKP